MHQRHVVTAEQANEALADLRALVFNPDYASLSGHSVRTIGWSDTAGRLLKVITVTEDDVTYGSQRDGASDDIDSRHYQHDRNRR